MLKLSEMGCLPYAQQRSPITISRRACAQWIQHRDVGVTATLKLSTAEEIEGQAVELLLDNDQDSSARRRYPDRSVRHRVAPHLRSQLCSQRHRNAALHDFVRYIRRGGREWWSRVSVGIEIGYGSCCAYSRCCLSCMTGNVTWGGPGVASAACLNRTLCRWD
uniref:Uncharacterized protein n=1 Tax=Physcomitrium patens TaxID=3218 RepID=A0A7I4BSW2_PHYPA